MPASRTRNPAECPPAEPTGTCSQNGLECRYGFTPEAPMCGVVSTCRGGNWSNNYFDCARDAAPLVDAPADGDP